jgi:hypothetical protein
MRALKVRTAQGMVELTADEARALRDRLAQAGAAHAAGETLSVSANASTSVTFSGIEKAAVYDVLDRWLPSESGDEYGGLVRLKNALAHDLERERS